MKNKVMLAILTVLVIILIVLMIIPKNKNVETQVNNENLKIEQETKNEQTPEEVVEDFYNLYYSGDVDSALKLVDFAGMEVYYDLEEDADFSEFKSMYEAYVASDEWKEYEEQIDEAWDSMIENLENTVSSSSVPDFSITNARVTEISEDFYEVILNIEEKDEEGNTTAQEDFTHYVFERDGECKIVYAEE